MSIQAVTDADDLMIVTTSGIMIRMEVETIRATGRNAQGVRLIQLRNDDAIADVTRLVADDEDGRPPTRPPIRPPSPPTPERVQDDASRAAAGSAPVAAHAFGAKELRATAEQCRRQTRSLQAWQKCGITTKLSRAPTSSDECGEGTRWREQDERDGGRQLQCWVGRPTSARTPLLP